MGIVDELRRAAEHLAANASREADDHRKRLEELAKETADLKHQFELQTSAAQRLEGYEPILGKEVCPWCWIMDGVKSGMRHIPSGRDDLDAIRCDRCNKIWEARA
jgi:hypothetical protein